MFTTTLDFLETVKNKAYRRIVFETIVDTILENNLVFKYDPIDFTFRINNPDTMDHEVINHILTFMRIEHAMISPEGLQ